MNEEWRIVEWAPRYRVSNRGRVKGAKGNILRHAKLRDHHVVSVYPEPRLCRVTYVHLLVLEAFVGPRPDGMQGCHNDGDPDNNGVENLRWDTPKSNQLDRITHGTDQRGHKNGNAKLTRERVIEIRRLRNLPDAERPTYGAIAERFGITSGLVGHVVRRIAWRHIQ